MHLNPLDRIPAANILIVDDNADNLCMLQEMLSLLGYQSQPVFDGTQALSLMETYTPDLILLDINMPGMNGFEVCAKIKENQKYSATPVIFLSARADTIGITQAFASGGVDYVTKPFVIEELISRISTHLKLHFTQLELKRYANHLEDLVLERTEDLRKAHERLKILDTTKNEFLDVIAHELRTPATSVLAVGQLAIMNLPNSEERSELMAIFEKGSQRLQRTIDNALLLARLQTSESFVVSENLEIKTLLDEAIKNGEFSTARIINQISDDVACKCRVAGNYSLAEQCVITILNVAFKMAVENTKILLDCQLDTDFSHLIFTAMGNKFAEENLNALFDTFSYERISSKVEELGLSLPLSAQIAILFGGKIEIHNIADPDGVQIILSLKRI